MGKKAKVNKLARMSDEERARYLQHRADIEEEARRRKRELILRFIKNKLEKEETFSRMNTAKINQGWRYILRKIKSQQMAVEIEGIKNSFNFMMERKERQLSSLMKAIESSDDQHQRAFQAHTENLSYFISIGSQRLNKLQTEYEFQKITLLENWDKEETDVTNTQEKSEFNLKLILYIQNRNFQNSKNEAEILRATAKNDARLEHEEDLKEMLVPRQIQIDTHWSQLREVYSSYLEHHKPIMGHYNSLREKDEFYQRDIARNELRIEHATEILLNLQKEWVNMTNNMAGKLRRMTSRKEELAQKYWKMKNDTTVQRSKETKQMEIMVNSSQDTLKRFEEVKEKLNKILQLAEICRKYESASDVLTEPETEAAVPELYEHLDSSMIEDCKEYKKLNKFFTKMNGVKIQSICLKTEKQKLSKENFQIKQYMKKYLTEMALKDGDERPKSMKLQSNIQKIDGNGKVLNRPVTCIEGVLSNAVLHEKRMKALQQRNRDIGGIRAYPRVQCWM